ncbi:MAG: SDR family oxidoreductase [Pseudomonadota bacterium]
MYRSVFKPGLFAGQSIIVTGGGSGLGRCTAHELAALGARVALIGRRRERLDTVRDEIADAGGVADCYAGDIRDETRVREMVGEVLDAHGRIDGLVNNAGGQFPALLRDISANGWDAVVRSNLTGGFFMARECYTQWMESHGGNVVNIVADCWMGMPEMGHSGAARAGMINLTETAAVEWAQSGVRVNAVAPGWVATSGFDTYAPEMQAKLAEWWHHVPLQRHGTEAEVSAAIVFLLCEAAAYITGVTLRVDGGAPNAKATWALPYHQNSTPYDGFHLAAKPRVMREE